MPVTTYRVTGPVLKWVVRMELSRLSALSREQVRFPVYADSNGVPVVLTSGYTAEVAFVQGSGQTPPESGDWKAATWDVTVTGNYVAGVEVGPGGTAGALTAGRWMCWVRITQTPTGEQVVRQAGQVIVY